MIEFRRSTVTVRGGEGLYIGAKFQGPQKGFTFGTVYIWDEALHDTSRIRRV